MKILRYIAKLLIAPALAVGAGSCADDDLMRNYDYTSMGEDVVLTVPVVLPEMDVKSRANLEEWQTNRVNNVWIRTYSAITKEATSDWVTLEDLHLQETETEQKVAIKSKSGMSYIVAVANVDNIGVSKSAPDAQKPLRELLADKSTDTWSGFLDIAVLTPSTDETVNSPYYSNTNGLPMCGAYTNLVKLGHVDDKGTYLPTSIDGWQTENFKSYPIPASGTGVVELKDGAIHLRRLVSQVTFNIIPGAPAAGSVGAGNKLTVKVNSYSIVNVPRYTWAYERSAANGMEANFADGIVNSETQADYYFSTTQYTGTSIEAGATEGSSTFSFWQGENKHSARDGIGEIAYINREEQWQTPDPDGVADKPDKDKYTSNTGLFKSLTGEVWSANNMATYVLVNCEIAYPGTVNTDKDGKPGTESGYRSGNVTYMIHLGYMDGPIDPTQKSAAAADFNCFRNTKYTYNVTVNGINDIRVEAFHEGDTPGAEGIVSDVSNPTINLDCHYHTFNIELDNSEISAFNPSNGSGFGFILTSYDKGVEHNYQESDFLNDDRSGVKTWEEIDESIKKYLDWVELRPTTGADVLAEYKPRKGSQYYNASTSGMDELTFNLVDAAHGITGAQKSASGWYTVFVNEYAYEAKNANEQSAGDPVWWDYVNQDPRRFYIKVSRSVSADGNSIYARSKYAGSQESILTYYSTNVVPEPGTGSGTENQVRGGAIGVERRNESLGLNLRRSFTSASDPQNGRYNCWQFVNYSYNNGSWSKRNGDNRWNYYLAPTSPQEIPAVNHGGLDQEAQSGAAVGVKQNPVMLPKIYDFRGSFNANNNAVNEYSAQTTQARSTTIEAISACMNRNRDNNGDGIIQREEMRWYVPAMGKYLRLILGNRTLGEYALMDYPKGGLTYKNTDTSKSSNDINGLYMFFGSEGRVLWGVEGLSTSAWCQWGENSPVAPWQVRCIRNLGTNLAADITTADKSVPAYVHEPNTANFRKTGGVVTMKYYNQVSAVRTTQYTANGRADKQMPVHTINDNTYNITYSAFQISEVTEDDNKTSRGGYYSYYDGTITGSNSITVNGTTVTTGLGWIDYISAIEGDTNPCTKKGDGWRLPNLKELAIMKNLGYFEGANTYDYFLSCTIGAFVKNGNYTTAIAESPFFNNDDSEHYFMSSNYDAISQAWNGVNTKYVRCVRDYPYNGN